MCGIAGILRITPPGDDARALRARPPWESIPEAWLDILDDSIKHRGPDGAGRYRDRAVREDGSLVDVALVHRRLAIIDLADGHQPMVSLGTGQGVLTGCKRYTIAHGLGLYEPGEYGWLCSGGPDGAAPTSRDRVAVAFNGCIYNHRELRKELQAAGHVFSTDHSDTEVLVHGWREWGENLAAHLEGMYAFTIWSSTGASFFLARDSFGEKPLYAYHVRHRDSWINCFGSVPPSATRLVSAIGLSSVTLPPMGTIARWVRFGWDGAPPGWNTGEIGPGMSVHYAADEPLVSTATAGYDIGAVPPPRALAHGPLYWDNHESTHNRLREDTIEKRLRWAVKSRLEADVPIGCFLSGGIDSSVLALFAREYCPDLQTFTVRMPDGFYDESRVASAVAGQLGTRHSVLPCTPRPADDLVQLIRQIGIPFGDSSLLPTHWVSRSAASEVKVAIGGDGADELFGGYQRYQLAGSLQSVPIQLAWLGAAVSSGASPKSPRSKLQRFLAASRGDGYIDLLSIFPIELLSEVLTLDDDQIRDVSSVHQSAEAIRDAHGAMRFDREYYLPNDLLRKVDSASMACPIEVRAPFLEKLLVYFALRTPIPILMPRGQRKGLLRAVARKYFPSEIVDRPKMGFAIPIGEWFRSNYGGMRDLLLDHLNSAEPFGPDSLGINSMINMKFVRQMLSEHDEAGEGSIWPWKGRDHSQRLYMLLVLSIWAKWLAGLNAGSPARFPPT